MRVPRYLLDTNICIYVRQDRQAHITKRFMALTPGEAAISVITFGELSYGAEKSHRRDEALSGLENLLQFLPVLSLPKDGGHAYGVVRAGLERQGMSISGNNLWIAAHALSVGLVLVTNNEREFRRVPELAIENWAVPG